MKIAIFNTMTPFVKGGAEIQAEDLERELVLRNHSVDLFRIPFPDYNLSKYLETFYSILSLNFNKYDKIIILKFPAFYVEHKDKILWMCHQFRQVYELWNTEYGFNDKEKKLCVIKKIITELDNKYISSANKIFTNGLEVQQRYLKYNNGKSIPLYPPLKDNTIFYNKSQGNYFYYPSRIDELKRQKLIVESFRYTKSDAKLIISGKFSDDEYRKEIFDIIKKCRLEEKVIVKEGWISEEEKCRLYAESLAVIFTPYLEDYGYITAEAFYSHKAVITCKDSGGPLGHVTNGKTGLIVDSSPKEIAKAIDYMYENRNITKEMGENAYNYISNCNITWDETIKRLLE